MTNYISSHTGAQIDLCVDTYQNAEQVQAAINAAINATSNNATSINTALINAIHPVGSIYMSINDTDPEQLFPGTTWERLQDTFLIAASDNYEVGSTGGKSVYEAKDMPKHSHTRGTMNITGDIALGCATGWVEVDNRYRWGALKGAGNGTIGGNSSGGYSSTTHLQINAADGWSGNTSESGTNDKATILPPYTAVYMWKRIS